MKFGVDLGGTKLAVGTLDGPVSLFATPDTTPTSPLLKQSLPPERTPERQP